MKKLIALFLVSSALLSEAQANVRTYLFKKAKPALYMTGAVATLATLNLLGRLQENKKDVTLENFVAGIKAMGKETQTGVTKVTTSTKKFVEKLVNLFTE